MADDKVAQQYVVFNPTVLLEGPLEGPITPESIEEPLWRTLEQSDVGLQRDDYAIESVPLVEFDVGEDIPRPPARPQVVFSVSSPEINAARRFRNAVRQLIGDGAGPLQAI